MKNFSFVLLFAIMIATTLNSCVEKCSRDNQVIGEECFCIKDDKGNFVDLHFIKKKDGVVSINVEPSSIKPNEDSIPGCITFSNDVKIVSKTDGVSLEFTNNGKEKLWIFETTLGEPNICKSAYNGGDEPTQSVSYKCICNAPGDNHCKGISYTLNNQPVIETRCVQVIGNECKGSGYEIPCQIELIKDDENTPLNPNRATLLIVTARVLEYNGLKYE